MAEAKKNVVLTRNEHPDHDPKETEFWTDGSWTSEYPDARKLTVREARQLVATRSWRHFVRAIVDYGTEDEHIAIL